MTQHDYNIANASGATVRADLNSLFQAIAENNSGATAPSTTFANQWWFDTANNLLMIRNAANTAWITVAEKNGNNWTPYRLGAALGTASTLDVGTTANKVVQLDGSAKLPAVDGSQLTGIAASSSPLLSENLALTASVAANALTIALKGWDGNDPSTSNKVKVRFRHATAATGTPTTLEITAATSLVISSGSTLGAANGTPFRIWIVGFNDGGTFRLGAVKAAAAAGVMPLGQMQLLSSTAEGGAGGADSAQVVYTGTGVTSKAFAILGFLEWSSGLTTAGTWDAAPTKIQLFGPGVPAPGDVVQTQYGSTTSGTTTTSTTFVATNLSVAITPTAACNPIQVHMSAALAATPGAVYAAAVADVYRDIGGGGYSSRSVPKAVSFNATTAIIEGTFEADLFEYPNSTSAVTYKAYAKTQSANSGTCDFGSYPTTGNATTATTTAKEIQS